MNITDQKIKPTVTIKDWSLLRAPNSSYRLTGNAIDHPAMINPVTFVTTSRILKADFEKGEVETRNTIYKLED